MSGGNKNDFTRACAFWGILVTAILFVVSGILNWCGVGAQIVNIFYLLAKIALLIAVALPAYDWVRYRKTGWKVVYWIALVIYVFGVVFGVIRVYIK